MSDSAYLLTPAEAARIIIDSVRPVTTETVPLADAQGRVPVADITSPLDIPPWDNSAMDGYAAHADDVRVDGELEVVARSRARTKPQGELVARLTLAPRPALRIFGCYSRDTSKCFAT